MSVDSSTCNVKQIDSHKRTGSSKYLEIISYNSGSYQADIKLEKADLRLIWAALSVYGNHFGQRLAFHVEKARVNDTPLKFIT
uniref:Uncharacterized protein n=1 Tax=Romanomermis culicivorax TaxID=13658 RepID=A0A915J650_ROMCU